VSAANFANRVVLATSGISEIVLSGTPLGDDGVVRMCRCFKKHHLPRILRLSRCNIAEAGLMAVVSLISNAAEGRANSKVFDLSGNYFSDSGLISSSSTWEAMYANCAKRRSRKLAVAMEKCLDKDVLKQTIDSPVRRFHPLLAKLVLNSSDVGDVGRVQVLQDLSPFEWVLALARALIPVLESFLENSGRLLNLAKTNDQNGEEEEEQAKAHLFLLCLDFFRHTVANMFAPPLCEVHLKNTKCIPSQQRGSHPSDILGLQDERDDPNEAEFCEEVTAKVYDFQNEDDLYSFCRQQMPTINTDQGGSRLFLEGMVIALKDHVECCKKAGFYLSRQVFDSFLCVKMPVL